MLGSQEFKSNMRFVSAKLKLPFIIDSALKRGEEGVKGGEVREGVGGCKYVLGWFHMVLLVLISGNLISTLPLKKAENITLSTLSKIRSMAPIKLPCMPSKRTKGFDQM